MRVGDVLAVLVDSPEDIAAFSDYAGQSSLATQNIST